MIRKDVIASRMDERETMLLKAMSMLSYSATGDNSGPVSQVEEELRQIEARGHPDVAKALRAQFSAVREAHEALSNKLAEIEGSYANEWEKWEELQSEWQEGNS